MGRGGWSSLHTHLLAFRVSGRLEPVVVTWILDCKITTAAL